MSKPLLITLLNSWTKDTEEARRSLSTGVTRLRAERQHPDSVISTMRGLLIPHGEALADEPWMLSLIDSGHRKIGNVDHAVAVRLSHEFRG